MTTGHLTPDRALRSDRKAATGALLIVGVAGSLMLIASAIVRAFSRSGGPDRALEYLPMSVLWVFVAGWILSPYLGAALLRRTWVTRRRDEGTLAIALLLMIAIAASSFLATSAFEGGAPQPTADGMTILVIPVAQWFVLAVAGVVMVLTRR